MTTDDLLGRGDMGAPPRGGALVSDDGLTLARLPTSAADLNLLLDDPRLPTIIRQMPSVQLHRLVCSLGRADVVELVALATPSQVREILDLELWQGDRLQIEETADWIHFLAGLPDGAARRDLLDLDPELVGSLLLDQARICLAEEADFPNEVEGRLYQTPDRWFLLHFPDADPAAAQRLVEIVEALYVADSERARQLLQGLLGELPTELEEAAYHWRNGRLQDLGFADPEEALLIYAYLDPRAVRSGEGSADQRLRADPESSGVVDLVTLLPTTPSFWSQGMAAVGDAVERARLALALLAVSNRALAADRVSPADEVGARRSVDALHWRLSLGLEQLCDGDTARAPAALGSVALLRVARLGHSLVLDVRRRLLPPLRAGRFGSAPGRLDRIDAPLAEQLRALSAPRPACFDTATHGARPFHDRRELAAAAGWIDQAEAAATLIADLGLGAAPPALTFGSLYRTAFVNRRLGRGSGPLDAAALQRFLAEAGDLGALAAESARTADAPPLAHEWVLRWLRELEEIARLDPLTLDLRFLTGLWLAR